MKHITWTLLLFLTIRSDCFSQTKIIMTKERGIYTVPCEVNGLKLKFIFDTGASQVTISLTEAIFMLKTGYLEATDIYGTSEAQLANGMITENTSINLREIDIYGLKLYNVKAFIVHELDAPLLLGQSAIEKLGPIQLNGRELTILNNFIVGYDYTTEKPTYFQEKKLNNPDWTILTNLNKFQTGKTLIEPEKYQDKTYLKNGESNIFLNDFKEGETLNLIRIEKGEIKIIERNVVRVYTPNDHGIHYYYYVYYQGYLGFVENIYLENW